MIKNKKISCVVWLIAACCMLACCEKIDDFSRKGAPRMKFKVSAVATKAAENTTAGLKVSGNSFKMITIADGGWTNHATGESFSGGKYFEAVIKYDGSSWNAYDAEGDTLSSYLWPNDVPLHIWSYYPSELIDSLITEPSAGEDSLVFHYTQPKSSTASPFKDASNQDDILFAGNYENREFDEKTGAIKDGKDSTVTITFFHALSEIRFAVSKNDGTFDPDLTITKVAISNAAGRGNCRFTPKDTTFKWTGLSDKRNFSQDVPALTDASWESGTYVKKVDGVDKTFDLKTYKNSFFMIPQTLESFAEITVTFKYKDTDGEEQSVDRSFSIDGDVWKAGYYYTYKIEASSVGQDITLTISLVEWEDENIAVLV